MGPFQHLLCRNPPQKAGTPHIGGTHLTLRRIFGFSQHGKKHHPYIPLSHRPPSQALGYQDQTTHFAIRKMIEPINRSHTARFPIQPVTLHMLQSAMEAITSICPVWEAILYRALLSTSFHRCTCVGEVAKSNGETRYIIRRENIQDNHNDITVTFSSHKHSTKAITQSRVLEWDGTTHCPVATIRAYLQIRPGPHNGHRGGPNHETEPTHCRVQHIGHHTTHPSYWSYYHCRTTRGITNTT